MRKLLIVLLALLLSVFLFSCGNKKIDYESVSTSGPTDSQSATTTKKSEVTVDRGPTDDDYTLPY